MVSVTCQAFLFLLKIHMVLHVVTQCFVMVIWEIVDSSLSNLSSLLLRMHGIVRIFNLFLGSTYRNFMSNWTLIHVLVHLQKGPRVVLKLRRLRELRSVDNSSLNRGCLGWFYVIFKKNIFNLLQMLRYANIINLFLLLLLLRNRSLALLIRCSDWRFSTLLLMNL